MIIPLLLGIGLIITTLITQALFLEFGQSILQRFGNQILGKGGWTRKATILSLTILWMLAALSIAIAIWAIAFFVVGAFQTFEESLYFALVSFTTLGFGDVILEYQWRLMAGIIAANGLLLLGLNTAVLIDVMARMRDGDMQTYNDNE
ncbi:MAG: two pore domain potassium channel family protein [Hellea sp.]|nr:two pore domain potassium channel family protein [Hellea sp.]